MVVRTILLLMILLAGGCAARGGIARSDEPNSAEMVVLGSPWHTVLIFPFEDLPTDLQKGLDRFLYERLVAFGWGDEQFFRAEEDTIATALQALFASKGSVLEVMGLDVEPESFFAEPIYRIPVTPTGRARAIAYINRTFRRDSEGSLVDAGAGLYGSRYYWSDRHYSINNTCNRWIIEALQEAGLPVSPRFAFTGRGAVYQISQLEGVTRNGEALPKPEPDRSRRLRLTRGGRP